MSNAQWPPPTKALSGTTRRGERLLLQDTLLPQQPLHLCPVLITNNSQAALESLEVSAATPL